MTGFMTLEMRRALRDVRYLAIAVALPIGLYLAVHRPVRLPRPAHPGAAPADRADGELVTALAAALPAMALVALTAVVSHHVQLTRTTIQDRQVNPVPPAR